MKRRHENRHAHMAAIALVAAMTLGPAVAMAAPCTVSAGQGVCAGACAATAVSAARLYAQGCPADNAQTDCPRAGARAAWLEGACNVLRCRSARAAQAADDWAAQRHGAFVDEDGDGVCDNAQNCARINGDCPGLGLGTGNGAGAGNASGAGYDNSTGQGYGAGCEHDAPNGAGQGAHLGWCGGRR